MKTTAKRIGRRQFVQGAGVTSASLIVGAVSLDALQQAPPTTGLLLHAPEGQRIPTPDGRIVTVKVDSERTPGVRMSMITEDLPAKTEIKVHLHEREDETIFIRFGSGIATLGEREFPVTAGATIYVPQGVWHGLRNRGTETLGMSAVFSPAGFEQIFKDRLVRPNRTDAETAAHRKKFGVVYKTP